MNRIRRRPRRDEKRRRRLRREASASTRSLRLNVMEHCSDASTPQFWLGWEGWVRALLPSRSLGRRVFWVRWIGTVVAVVVIVIVHIGRTHSCKLGPFCLQQTTTSWVYARPCVEVRRPTVPKPNRRRCPLCTVQFVLSGSGAVEHYNNNAALVAILCHATAERRHIGNIKQYISRMLPNNN